MLKGSLSDLFPHMPPEYEPVAVHIYRTVFGDLPLTAWSKEGSSITRYVNGKRLSFAPRRAHCTIAFRGRAAVEFYRFLGGDCPVGEVTIKIPYETDWDAAPVKKTIEWYLCSS